jgi:mRNA interferase RelE/StbE
MPEVAKARAYVRLIDPAVEDLKYLLKSDPQIVRKVFKKFLLLESDPNAGEPLMGQLIGWRKLTVGDRHWRIVWRITTDDNLGQVVEIAEVWAVGSRSNDEIYDEVRARIRNLPDSPSTTSLADIVGLLAAVSGRITVATEPKNEPVPEWLAKRLRDTAGLAQAEIDRLSPEEAMTSWEEYISRPKPPSN